MTRTCFLRGEQQTAIWHMHALARLASACSESTDRQCYRKARGERGRKGYAFPLYSFNPVQLGVIYLFLVRKEAAYSAPDRCSWHAQHVRSSYCWNNNGNNTPPTLAKETTVKGKNRNAQKGEGEGLLWQRTRLIQRGGRCC